MFLNKNVQFKKNLKCAISNERLLGEMELLNLKTRQICFGLVARGARDGDGRPIGWPTDAVNPRGSRGVSFKLTKLGANFEGAGVKLKHEP